MDQFLFDTNFYKKVFSKQAIEIGVLISIIPRNMFKLHVKIIYTKYDKSCIFEKNPHKNYHHEKKFWDEWSRIPVIQ